MVGNYWKLTWRNFTKNKFFSLINIFGLAVGLTCCMLIGLYIQNEFSFDAYHSKAKRIYQLGTIHHRNEKEWRTASAPGPMAPALKNEFSDIEATARLCGLFRDDKTLLQYDAGHNDLRSFYETKGFLADSSFFSIFDYNFLEGNPSHALTDPNTIVLNEEIAKKIFGNESAMGKVIRVGSSTNGSADYKVTGVFRPGSQPSHIDARFFLSMYSGEIGDMAMHATNFANNNIFYTYLLLKPGVDKSRIETQLPGFVKKYMERDLQANGATKTEFLIPLRNIHLYSGVNANVTPNGSLSYLYILGSIAVFILLVACINFMNLSTARSVKRAGEVGIRKVLGAGQRQLVFQFLGEAVLLALLSFLIAILLTIALLPFFSQVTNTSLHLDIPGKLTILVGFLGLAVVTGLIAGSYPALYLSAFKPIRVLKGKFSNSLAAISFRKVLVVFQFFIAALLIVGAITIHRQMLFLRSADIGFQKEQQLVIPLRSDDAKRHGEALKTAMERVPGIQSVGSSAFYPGVFNASDMNFRKPEDAQNMAINIKMNYVDGDFMKTLDFKPVAGRGYSNDYLSDTTNSIVLNEKAVEKLGFHSPADIIHQTIAVNWADTVFRFQVVGVLRDFNYEGLQRPIEPMGFFRVNSSFSFIIAHMSGEDISGQLKEAAAAWKKVNPNEPFEYSFLDLDFQKNYATETRLSKMVRYFMIVAISICCLGLLGLVTFSAEQRTKEIGIRKVLGSSVSSIVGLLSRDFLKLVLIGNLLAMPVAWYIMHRWMEGFAYRTSLSWWFFALAVLLSFFIAVVTLSLQSIRAALADPVRSLRTE